jgi:Subtilase family
MARNPLLGNGQKMTHQLVIDDGGGDKNPPYTFDYARQRLIEPLAELSAWITNLSSDACPNDEIVFSITLHPRYIAKTSQPSGFLRAAGLTPIGRRERNVAPEHWGVKKHPDLAPTDQVFVRGKRSRVLRLSGELQNWSANTVEARELTQIERIEAFTASDKVIAIPQGDRLMTEVVLHNAGLSNVMPDFTAYAKRFKADVLEERRRVVGLLTFVPVEMLAARAKEIAAFAFVRVVRAMPALRPMPAPLLRSASAKLISLPTEGPRSETRTVVFDGGLTDSAQNLLGRWVNYIEPPNLASPLPVYQAHGFAVTSSLLFGPLDENTELERPFGRIDHVRVLDQRSGANQDMEYYDVLDRILSHLQTAPQSYSFGCLSLGPSRAITDDEVTAWTAALDVQLSHGNMVLAVAAGNDGELDAETGLNRLQPPSDGVNILCVGASDSMGPKWGRAPYSCVGPGRRPGVFKPDGLAFGGSDATPFGVLTDTRQVARVAGTSFAAPFALRSAVGVAATLEQTLHPLTIRALMIHRAEDKKKANHAQEGWGRFQSDVSTLLTSDDDEAIVVYEGDLPLSESLRAPIALPDIVLQGKIDITATLVLAPEVDAEHVSTYTRAGIEAQFRPHKDVFVTYENGKVAGHPETGDFFTGVRLMKRTPEYVRRKDGHKWEPVLRARRTLDAEKLSAPCFDLYYHHRERGQTHPEPQPIRYALIVSVKAQSHPNFYQQVISSFPVLIPLRQRIDIRV